MQRSMESSLAIVAVIGQEWWEEDCVIEGDKKIEIVCAEKIASKSDDVIYIR